MFLVLFLKWAKACLDDELEIGRRTTTTAVTCYDV
jgi:hypothetical protein